MTPDNFPTLLRNYRERAGRSRNSLAHEIGVDTSHLTHIEHGERNPPARETIEGIARALRLSPYDRDHLLIVAGYTPQAIMVYGWDECQQEVAETLNCSHLTPQEKLEYRETIMLISRKWCGPTNGVHA